MVTPPLLPMPMSAIGVIPARFAAQRFPGKPLALILGRPMIQWVHERACRAKELSRVIVATDDERVAACVRGFGGEAMMTSDRHQSGTDRVAEIARLVEADAYVNIQGDEPLIDPGTIDGVLRALIADERAAWATLAAPLRTTEEYLDPSVVKVAVGPDGAALYFSRAPIPWQRDRAGQRGLARVDEEAHGAGPPELARRHVGLYAFRRQALADFSNWPPSPLELCESLEQLRALEHGARIVVAETSTVTLAIDNPEDIPVVEARLRALLAAGER